MRPVVRSPTSAVLSGRTAIPVGAASLVATTAGSGLLRSEAPADGVVGVGAEGAPGAPGRAGWGMAGLLPSPEKDGFGRHVGALAPAPAPHPASSSTATTAEPARRMRTMGSSLPALAKCPQL